MILVGIVQTLEVLPELFLELLKELSSLPAELVLLKSIQVLLRNDDLGNQLEIVESHMRDKSKGWMEGNSEFELRIRGSHKDTNYSPAETHHTHRLNLLLLLNKWQEFLINIVMDHLDGKLGNKLLNLLFGDIRVLLVEHLASEEVSHVDRVSLVGQLITNLPRSARIEAKDVIDKDYDFITGSLSRDVYTHAIGSLYDSSVSVYIV